MLRSPNISAKLESSQANVFPCITKDICTVYKSIAKRLTGKPWYDDVLVAHIAAKAIDVWLSDQREKAMQQLRDEHQAILSLS